MPNLGINTEHNFFNTTYISQNPKSIYVDAFKKAEVRPLYKEGGRTEKANYGAIIVLSNISKIYERCWYGQICSYFEKVFSKYQYGFCKVNVLLTITEQNENSR